MATTFFFYDLETTGFNPQEARIVQFAGQRTSLELEPIGQPVNTLLKLTDDVVPDPRAVLITGITPQMTIADGINEDEFLAFFHAQVSVDDTIFVGYNNIRFDDEFLRFLQYRNFYDPYSWHWRSGRSRWDLLDVVRMTRALRPTGIVWPVDHDHRPTNRLELLALANKLNHARAHDALSDVEALILLAKLLKTKQPKIFNFLLEHRDKRAVAKLVGHGEPFLYTSGKYAAEYEKTTIVSAIGDHPQHQGVLVYDLRVDPSQFIAMNAAQLAEAWRYHPAEDTSPRLPIKTLQFNRCPAVAPLSVLTPETESRLKLDRSVIRVNQQKLGHAPVFSKTVLDALQLLDSERAVHQKRQHPPLIDATLYDSFITDADQKAMTKFHATNFQAGDQPTVVFHDQRLQDMVPLFLARNYPMLLSTEQRIAWEKYRTDSLLSGNQKSRLANFFQSIQTLDEQAGLTADERFLLEELKLWGEQIMPVDDDAFAV